MDTKMKFKNVKEKLLFIEKLEKETNFSVLKQISSINKLSKDENTEVRIELARQLVLFDNDEIEDILYHMLYDKNRMVRLEAVDSLSIGCQMKTIEKVRTMLSKEGYLIRGYAAATLFDLIINHYGFNKKALEKYYEYTQETFTQEENIWVKIQYYINDYLLGDESGLDWLEKTYKEVVDSQNFSLIWTLLNSFQEIMTYRNKERIHNILNYKKEKLNDNQQIKLSRIIKKQIVYKVLIIDLENTYALQTASKLQKDLPDGVKIFSLGLEKEKLLNLYSYDFVIGIGIGYCKEFFSFCNFICIDSEEKEMLQNKIDNLYDIFLLRIKNELIKENKV